MLTGCFMTQHTARTLQALVLTFAAAVLAVIAVGCGDDGGTTSTGTTSVGPAPEPLVLADGTSIQAQSMSCYYRQSTGASDDLELQLQFLDTPNTVAFAVYVSDVTPATPYSADAAGADFELFTGGTGYRKVLESGEVTVALGALPEPSTLSRGQSVQLNGSLEFAQLTVPEVNALGEVGQGSAEIAPGSVAFSCTANFQISEVME